MSKKSRRTAVRFAFLPNTPPTKRMKLSENVENLLEKEKRFGLTDLNYYLDFQPKIEKIKLDLLTFLIEQKSAGKKVAAYGAAAKGNTLLNFCGVKKDLIDFVVDASPHKQNLFLPASHIPIVDESFIKRRETRFCYDSAVEYQG